MIQKPARFARPRLQFFAVLFTTFLISVGAVANADARSEQKRVQRDVKKITQAVHSGDVGTVLQYTHPKIIKMMGGRKSARATVVKMAKDFRQKNMTVAKLSFPSPPKFVRGNGDRRFVIAPTFIVFDVNGQKVESLNFQLGVLDPGAKSWKYLDGSQINRRNVVKLFPGFPRNYSFPRKDMRVR